MTVLEFYPRRVVRANSIIHHVFLVGSALALMLVVSVSQMWKDAHENARRKLPEIAMSTPQLVQRRSAIVLRILALCIAALAASLHHCVPDCFVAIFCATAIQFSHLVVTSTGRAMRRFVIGVPHSIITNLKYRIGTGGWRGLGSLYKYSYHHQSKGERRDVTEKSKGTKNNNTKNMNISNK